MAVLGLCSEVMCCEKREEICIDIKTRITYYLYIKSIEVIFEMYVDMYVHVCLHICICIYIHINMQSQTNTAILWPRTELTWWEKREERVVNLQYQTIMNES